MINYVIVTPVKDEEKYISFVLDSVISQTIKPAQWIIVDDGSIDKTRDIIAGYTATHEWISCIETGNTGERKPGNRHLIAFYEGYKYLSIPNWEFIVKLDGDLSFEPNYFEKCFSYFNENKQLGICGGLIYNKVNGKLIPEQHPHFHVRGATKIYKRSCWEKIGGIKIFPSYDTIDEVKANSLGFHTRTFSDLKVVHHKFTGSSYGVWKSSVKNGIGDYVCGYHPVFMLGKCIKRLFFNKSWMESIGLLFGYFSGYLKGIQQIDDKILIQYLRSQQLRYIFLKDSIWR